MVSSNMGSIWDQVKGLSVEVDRVLRQMEGKVGVGTCGVLGLRASSVGEQ